MADNKINPFNGLQIDFLGLPMVFNDGQTANKLIIALTNNNFSGALQTDQNNIVLTRNTPVSIWFVADVHQASAAAHMRNWALTSYDALHDAQVSLTAAPGNWDIQRSDDLSGNPLNDSLKGWKLTAREDLTLWPGHSLMLTLSGFTSAEPDGPTSAYCQVQLPEPGADGKLQFITKVIGPITKSRVMITGERMGIGTGTPNSALEVNGGVAAKWITFNKLGEKYWGFGGAYTAGNKIEAITLSVEDYVALGIYPGSKGFAPPYTSIIGDLKIEPGHDGGGNARVIGNLSTSGSIEAGDITSTGRMKDKSGLVMPVGTIVAYGGKEPPPGWLLCDGQYLVWNEPDEGDTVDEYAELRRLVGDRVPDLRNRFVVGAGGNTRAGATGGEAEHVLTKGEMPNHAHAYLVAYTENANNGYVSDVGKQQQWSLKVTDRNDYSLGMEFSEDDDRTYSIQSAGGDAAHNNLPPYYALTYIIKY